MAYFNRDNNRPRSRGGNFRRDDFKRGDRGDRQMFDAVCSNCGKSCQVPFRPTGDKPVYCSDCFEKMGGRNDRQDRPPSFDRPRFDDRKPVIDQNKAQFEALNVKIDRILKLLELKVTETVVSAPAGEKTKTPKIKKVVKKTTPAKAK